jgi:heat shock protein HspQ
MTDGKARFSVGQLVRHLRFGYRGVVADVDPTFGLSDEWYDQVARSRPPRDRPWYHVLVDEGDSVTYVAERHLAADESEAPIRHPLVDQVFSGFEAGHYLRGGESH